MGVEGILEKIRQKSKEECREIVNQARQQAREQSQKVLDQARRQGEETAAAAQKQAEVFLLGRRQQLRLETNIALLNQKRALLEQLKGRGLEALERLEPARWHALYFKLVSRQKMEGRVTVCCRPETAQRYSLSENCRVWQNQSRGKASYQLDTTRGPRLGIWLVGESCDADLSGEALLEELFQTRQAELADCLFGAEAGKA